ncbi:MAG: hypothetical protein KA223_02555 [Candidatus Accumulibacter sp.]|nr:hypothetical protein [Accumulibacter sp.]
MDQFDLREFGRLEAKVEAQGREIGDLKATVTAMAGKIDELLALANKGRGGLWMGMTLVSMASAAIGWVLHALGVKT